MGYERRFNPSLKFKDRDKFTVYMQDDQPVKPANILNIVATNQGRLPLTMETPVAKPFSPAKVAELMEAGHVVVDTRSSAEFGSGHIPGAYNVQMSSLEFEQRVGWVTPDDAPLILVTNTAEEAQRCIFNMAFIALDSRVAGYLDDGMDAWVEDGRHVEQVPQMDVIDLKKRLSENGLQVLDVRDKEEWEEGHIKAAHFMPYTSLVPQLDIPAQIDKLDLSPEQSIAVTCATGKRSSTAISILRRNGFKHLYNVIGGMEAWEHAGYEMIDAEGNVCNI
ncbi:MAG TPA: rhodanese-like domain-containing protein [Anaerolineae bacterium]|nr:rhodanese-like domain-containing protein [Anaerolineae bacterium]